MISIEQDPDLLHIGTVSALCILVAVLCRYLLFSRSSLSQPTRSSVIPTGGSNRSYNEPCERLKLVSGDSAGTDVDIIAIHGLDVSSRVTWTWKDPRDPSDKSRWCNWLKDKTMLPASIERARIFTYDWPADLLPTPDLAPKTVTEYAEGLLQGLQSELLSHDAPRDDRPVIFIASCLGGVILSRALVSAHQRRKPEDRLDKNHRIVRATGGIIFLATPFRDTSFEDVAEWATPSLSILAWLRQRRLSRSLLHSTRTPDFDSVQLITDLSTFCQDPDYPCLVEAFYETRKTTLIHKAFPYFPSIFLKQKLLVDQASATPNMPSISIGLNRRHVLMNKFQGPFCEDYLLVSGKISEMAARIRRGSLLAQADRYLLTEYYSTDRLAIERLSGKRLPMEQCYVNLAIVAKATKKASSQGVDPASAWKSLLARQQVETPKKSDQVQLENMFDTRELDGEMITPRRVFIQGRAGVGKTTMCKRMVYNFIKENTWSDLFDRVLWIPLRRLKQQQSDRCDLESLLCDEFFRKLNHTERKKFARALEQDLPRGRTLFILDGLDEVTGGWDRGHSMSQFVEELLMYPNVIITSRPSGVLPTKLESDLRTNLQLDTIGFYPDQVKAYLKSDSNARLHTSAIQTFLDKSPIIQGLVRIPIQLDALCYTWEEISSGSTSTTMTGLYQAIERRLWAKDFNRLSSERHEYGPSAAQLDPLEIEDLVEDEVHMLELLGFTGMVKGIFEFTSADLAPVFRHRRSSRKPRSMDRGIHSTLEHLSFLRTSDPELAIEHRTYHFIHLTFQEYFAARYFARQWRLGDTTGTLRYEDILKDPLDFLRQKKYSARFGIMWRFVAGLLAKDSSEELRFFTLIEQKPLDILGPAHQRLVMSCLGQASGKLTMRASLEKRLREWIVFELNDWVTEPANSLAADPECPDEYLTTVIYQSSDKTKKKALRSLRSEERVIPGSIMEEMPSLLSHADSVVQKRAFEACAIQSALPPYVAKAVLNYLLTMNIKYPPFTLGRIPEILAEIFKTMAERPGDEKVMAVVFPVLEAERALPEDALQIIFAWFDHSNEHIRRSSFKTLCRQSTLPKNIERAVAARIDSMKPESQAEAFTVLKKIPSLSQEVLDKIMEKLSSRNKDHRHFSVQVFRGQSILPLRTEKALASLLDGTCTDTQAAVLNILEHRPNLSGDVLEGVSAKLGSCEKHVRYAATRVLFGQSSLLLDTARMGPVEKFTDKWHAHSHAAKSTSQSMAEAMLLQVCDEDVQIREAAFELLQRQSPLPQSVADTIMVMLPHAEPDVQPTLLRLQGHQPNWPVATVKAVQAQLQADHSAVRASALGILGSRPPPLSRDTMEAVVARLDDTEVAVRCAALQVLARHSPLSDTNRDLVLTRLTNEETMEVQVLALKVLKKQPPQPNAILELVLERIQGYKISVILLAFDLLIGHTLVSEKIAEVVVSWSRQKFHALRAACIGVLSSQVELSHATLEKIAKRLNDGKDYVSYGVEEMLRKHEGFYQDVCLRRYFTGLYRVLQRRSYGAQLSWCVSDEGIYIELPDGSRQVCMLDSDEFMSSVRKARQENLDDLDAEERCEPYHEAVDEETLRGTARHGGSEFVFHPFTWPPTHDMQPLSGVDRGLESEDSWTILDK